MWSSSFIVQKLIIVIVSTSTSQPRQQIEQFCLISIVLHPIDPNPKKQNVLLLKGNGCGGHAVSIVKGAMNPKVLDKFFLQHLAKQEGQDKRNRRLWFGKRTAFAGQRWKSRAADVYC